MVLNFGVSSTTANSLTFLGYRKRSQKKLDPSPLRLPSVLCGIRITPNKVRTTHSAGYPPLAQRPPNFWPGVVRSRVLTLMRTVPEYTVQKAAKKGTFEVAKTLHKTRRNAQT